MIRAQFWIKFRGRVDVFLDRTPGDSADELARYAVLDALAQFERKWPAPHRDELACIGLEDLETGRQVLRDGKTFDEKFAP